MSSADAQNRLQGNQPPKAALATGPATHGQGAATEVMPRIGATPGLRERAAAMCAAEADNPAPSSCQQSLYVSVFFDGTGNNREADLPTLEHSNVARMFRAHRDEPERGIHRLYVPGIGTLFEEIGDKGKGPIPVVDHHNGMGGMGQDRLDWAFNQLKKRIQLAEARAQNPTNKISLIRLAVFGFSRGATLARAFIRDLFDAEKGFTFLNGDELRWKQGRYPLQVEFMGLWDTVASVGSPMSSNNVRALRSERRAAWKNVGREVFSWKGAERLRAVDLAFGTPGADPAPGSSDGHGAWADGLAIPPQVRRCVHFIAGHEVRNSFPVDSVMRGNRRPPNCTEIVFPGVHSDVGGGYRPGEGGKGNAKPKGTEAEQTDSGLVLSRIPLEAMYQAALEAGVPLHRKRSAGWGKEQAEDFDINPVLLDRFAHYINRGLNGSRPLGAMILAHMREYYAWRWYRIAKGRAVEQARTARNQAVFAKEQEERKSRLLALERERAALGQRRQRAQQVRTSALQGQWQNPNVDLNALRARTKVYDDELAACDARMKELNLEIDKLNNSLNLAADDAGLTDALSKFDQELLHDVQSIRAAIAEEPGLRNQLRPHYRNLLETFENEFVLKNGLRDEKVIAFFDHHVHDSLAGFDKDCTLPSDPRAVYVGGDVKLRFAHGPTLGAKSEALV